MFCNSAFVRCKEGTSLTQGQRRTTPALDRIQAKGWLAHPDRCSPSRAEEVSALANKVFFLIDPFEAYKASGWMWGSKKRNRLIRTLVAVRQIVNAATTPDNPQELTSDEGRLAAIGESR